MDAIADFVARFADFWKTPSPERLAELLMEDVVLNQPLARPMHGLKAAQAEFTKIFGWLPDLRVDVDRWCGSGDTVFIEIRLRASFAGRLHEWPGVDVFTLRGDRAIERVTYYDSVPLALRLLRHPASWWGWWRSGTFRPWH